MNAKQIVEKSGFSGDVNDSSEILEQHSHDASMFEIVPELVVFPNNSEDIKKLVKSVAGNKKSNPSLSLTARSAGTDMAGGAINDSIIVNISKYMTKIGTITNDSAEVQPGVFYRDFEEATLHKELMMPSYPASREMCTVGGMVANNSGGEKSLEFGKIEKFINELQVVFSDGNEYTVKPLTKKELDNKIAQNNFEGSIYKHVFELVDKNYDQIKKAKPNVTKNSMGYNLWNVWDRETGIFDLSQLIVGSEGTLGFVTNINFKLIKAPKHSGTLVMFLRDISDLGQLIKDIMVHRPATFEGFDNYTLMLSVKLFFFFHKRLGWTQTIKLGLQLLPSALKLYRGIPKMVLLIEFTGDTPDIVAKKVHQMRLDLQEKGYGHESLFEEDETEAQEKKFWIMPA